MIFLCSNPGSAPDRVCSLGGMSGHGKAVGSMRSQGHILESMGFQRCLSTRLPPVSGFWAEPSLEEIDPGACCALSHPLVRKEQVADPMLDEIQAVANAVMSEALSPVTPLAAGLDVVNLLCR